MRKDLAEVLQSLPLVGVKLSEVKKKLSVSDAGWSEKQRAILTFQAMMKGARFYTSLVANKNGYICDKIPELSEWLKTSVADPKDRAQWFIDNVPSIGTFEYNAFKRLSKTFEFESNEFWYWRRKLS